MICMRTEIAFLFICAVHHTQANESSDVDTERMESAVGQRHEGVLAPAVTVSGFHSDQQTQAGERTMQGKLPLDVH